LKSQAVFLSKTKFSTPPRRATVHEMARDEAGHGKALKGMLERYFK
jgi:hypothetical protein